MTANLPPADPRDPDSSDEMAFGRDSLPRAEERLRDSEERYRRLFETMVQGVVFQAADGRIVSANPAAALILGLSPDQLLGKTSMDPDWKSIRDDGSDLPGEEHPSMVALRSGKPVEQFVMGVTSGQTRTWILVNATPLFLPEVATPYQVYTTFEDITPRRRAEEALRRANETLEQQIQARTTEWRDIERRLSYALEATEQGVWDWDVATGRVTHSAQWCRILGLDDSFIEHELDTFVSMLADEDRPRVMFTVRAALDGGEPYCSRHRMRRADGQIRWVLDRGRVVERDADGRPIRMVGVIVDITDATLAETSLRESEARLRAISEGAQDAVVMMDPGGVISHWNPAAERIFGYAAQEAIGRNLHEMIAPSRYHEDHLRHFATFRRTGQGSAVGRTLELEARHKDGHEIPVELSLSALRAGDGWRSVGILRDITARKRADTALREANQRLELASTQAAELAAQAEAANAAKSEFLANMSHEIRNPMNGVIGMTGLLLETNLDDEQLRYAETVRASGESLLVLINDILDFSKIEAGKIELEILDFDVLSLLDDLAATLVAGAREKRLDLVCAADPDVPPSLRGDPGRLRQVLANLASNALKFTAAGSVTIRVSVVAAHENDVVLRFSVRDTGIGIPADKVARLFTKFSQVDASTTRRFGGTGLGLAISKQLAELMGGEIGVVTTEGQGSEFWFTARLGRRPGGFVRRPSTVNRSIREASAPLVGRSARILLAEDNITNQKVAVGMLKKWGLTVDVVANGAEAVQSIATIPYDLILMDVEMPDVDGLEATRQIRAAEARQSDPSRRIPIVAMTAHAMHGYRDRFIEAGMDDYVTKPVDPLALAATLDKWLPKRPTASDESGRLS